MKVQEQRNDIVTKENIRCLMVIFSISMLQMAGMNISPALQKIALEFPSVPEEAIQSLVTLPSLFIVFASLCSSALANLISKRRTILAGSFLFVISGMLPMLFYSFQVIRISRMLIGIGIGIMLPLNTSLLFSIFPNLNHRNTIIGWQSCASALGNVLATTLAGILVGIHYRLVFAVHLIGMLPLLSTLFFLPQDKIENNGESGVRRENNCEKEGFCSFGRIKPHTIIWLLVMFLYMGYLNSFSTKMSLLVETNGIGDSSVSALGISLLTVGSFVGGLLYGKIAQTLKLYTFSVGVLLSSIGILLMALANHPLVIYLSAIFTGGGLAMVAPAILVRIVEKTSEKNHTMVIAVNSAVSNLGLSLSPYLTSATAIALFGVSKTIRNEYLVSAIALFLMGVIHLICTAVRRKKEVVN